MPFKQKITWSQLLKKSSIGRRFALSILGFSSVVTLLSTILQLGIEYQKDINAINARFDEVRDSYYQSLVNSLWTTSNESLQLQLDGIIKLPDMQYLEVRSENNTIVAHAGFQKLESHVISQDYPLVHIHEGQKVTLGTLHIVSTLDGVYARLKSKIAVILVTQGIKTFLVSLFILYLFYILVGRHLSTIARFVSHVKEFKSDTQLALDREESSQTQDDELSAVVEAINTMRSSLKTSFLEIQKSEENLAITLKSIADGVIATDNQGLITRMNPVAERLTGWTFEEALGHPMKEIFNIVHADTRLEKANPIELVMERGEVVSMENETILLARDEKEYQITERAAPMRNSGGVIVGAVLVFSDVTQQKIRDKLFMMQTRQAQMGEMLSMIAHQWRQPLTVISALMNKQRLNITLEEYTPEDLLQSFTDVDTQVQYLSRTISDFRDFFKPDKAKTTTTNTHIFTKVLDLMGHTLQKEKIEVIQNHMHDEPYATYEHEVVQVFLNLFKNAQDAFNERKITDRQLVITSNQKDNYTVITVDDNAQGIDESVIDTLFLPYVSTKNDLNGTGLGLYMCKTIIEEHCQGTIRVENTSKGAKFTIMIPLTQVNT